MTPAQHKMYWSLIQRLRDVAESKGLKFGDVERHAFHKKALGIAKSSKDFTNADLDKIKAHALAILEPDNLAAQLRAQDQPKMRRIDVQTKCLQLIEEMGIGRDSTEDRSRFLRSQYLDGIVKNITRGEHVSFTTCDDRVANNILQTLQRRIMAHRRKAEEQGVPF